VKSNSIQPAPLIMKWSDLPLPSAICHRLLAASNLVEMRH
jgi:hypothetical protein